jgi:hypothetical protein
MERKMNKVIEHIMFEEGGWSVNPKPGGTYMGILRNSVPGKNWKGWPLVDAYKKSKGLKYNEVIQDQRIFDLWESFFKELYWDRNLVGSFILPRVQLHMAEWLYGANNERVWTALNGAFGDKGNRPKMATVAKINAMGAKAIPYLSELRKKFYLVSKASQKTKLAWIKRTERANTVNV